VLRPSPASVFIALAVATAIGVGAFAKRAEGAHDAASLLPSDIESHGFEPRGRVGEVTLLEATRELRLSLANGPIRAVPPSRAHLAAARGIVTRELGRYPQAFLARVKLGGVVLLEELVERETPIPSLPNVGGLLLLDVDAAESDVVRTLHHEIFHFADLADDGKLADDPVWAGLNAPGFTYGAGGRSLRSWAARTDVTGFVSGYATSGPEEDKAETFAFVVARPEAVRARLGGDPVLSAKVRDMQRRVAALDGDAPRALGFFAPR
jgi:hypothetical protein